MDLFAIIQKLGSFVVLLGTLVFVHELGHFVVARWAGVRVLSFSIGFGPVTYCYVRPGGAGGWCGAQNLALTANRRRWSSESRIRFLGWLSPNI